MRNEVLFTLPDVQGAQVFKHESVKSEFKFEEPRIWAVVKDMKVVQYRAFVDRGDGELTFMFGWLQLVQLARNPSEGRHRSVTRLGRTTAEQWARESLGKVVLLQDVPYYANAERKYNEWVERANRVVDEESDVPQPARLPWVDQSP